MPISVSLKFWFLSNHWWILSALSVAVAITLAATEADVRLVIPLLGTPLSIFYFLQKQKIEEARLFREIFKDFNQRYDQMNEELATILDGPKEKPLSTKERSDLVDYFNLCGEEYLYCKHGFIYPDVWRAWQNGMQQYLRDDRVRKVWTEELSTNSYYGLKIKV